MEILLSLLPINPRLKVHLHLDTYYPQLDAGQKSTSQIAKRQYFTAKPPLRRKKQEKWGEILVTVEEKLPIRQIYDNVTVNAHTCEVLPDSAT